MKINFLENEKLLSIEGDGFVVPFEKRYGFYAEIDGENEDVVLNKCGESYTGVLGDLHFALAYEENEEFFKIKVKVENKGEKDFDGEIGFHAGVNSYFESYPQWHEPFFPTLLRCEKTHMWGYYMNSAENSLAVATDGPVSYYDIKYNIFHEHNNDHNGHRLYGTDFVFIKNVNLPERHPDNLKVLAAGGIYENTIYYIPVKNKDDIFKTLSSVAKIPLIQSEKYTYELGEKIDFELFCKCGYECEFTGPDGKVRDIKKRAR